ncbi:hypothetical protein AGDE_08769 [Angomonas deanei]|nr:hypothetical protein AGDE_08769 [Angomonas deanei]|eukprot:EPY32285.1 hypothetical protein AGDE_08769 [Angomonas deanei]
MISVVLILLSIVLFVVYRALSHKCVALNVTNTLKEGQFDYVVVGGGAAGLSAAGELLTSDPQGTVLVIERGKDYTPVSLYRKVMHLFSTMPLLSFYTDSIAIPPGALPGNSAGLVNAKHVSPYVVRRPLRERKVTDDSSKGEEYKTKEELLLYTPFPRGLGVGGTSLLDWSISFESVLEGTAASSRLTIRTPPVFSPIGQAFVETVKHNGLDRDVGECVFPCDMHVDSSGRKHPLTNVLAGLSPQQLRRLTVLTHATVKDFSVEEGHNTGTFRVSKVRCVSSSCGSLTVAVSKGVVLSAGIVHSPRLLCRLQKSIQPSFVLPTVLQARDALVIPLVFKCYNGLTYDKVNTQTLQNLLAWVCAQKGALLHPLCDCLCTLYVNTPAGRVPMKLVVVPFGGRDARQYYSMGWDRSLASYPQAFTILLVLEDTASLRLEFNTEISEASKEWFQGKGVTPLLCEDRSVLSGKEKEQILSIFQSGIRKVRKIIQEPPISHFCFGSESVDFTLLEEDPAKAVKLAKLVHTPLKKYSRQMKERWSSSPRGPSR